MASPTTWILIIGLFLIIAIFLVIILKIERDKKNLILSGFHLILIIGYVMVTYYLVSVNEKLVSIQKTPVVTITLDNQLKVLQRFRLQQGKDLTEEEKNNEKLISKAILTLNNKSNNNAMDVRVTVTAFVNRKRINSSPPLDGSIDWRVQAGHSVIKPFYMQEDYLTQANYSIRQMFEERTEANKNKQFVLKIKISYSDGFGKRLEQPELSWFFDFKEKGWSYIT